MNRKETHPQLHVEFRQTHCSLAPERLEYMASEELKLIPALAADLKFDSLHVDLHKHPHKDDYHVKMSLKAGSRSLFTGERHAELMPAFRACVNQMTAKLREAKQKQRSKMTAEREAILTAP